MKSLALIAASLLLLVSGDPKEDFIKEMKSYQNLLTQTEVYQMECGFFYHEMGGKVYEDMSYQVWRDGSFYIIELPEETRLHRTDSNYVVHIFPNKKEIIVNEVATAEKMQQMNVMAQFDEEMIRTQLGEVQELTSSTSTRKYKLLPPLEIQGVEMVVEIGSGEDMRYTMRQTKGGVKYETVSTLGFEKNKQHKEIGTYQHIYQSALSNAVLPPAYSLYNLTYGQP
jgi:hypothetical protein